MNRACGSRAFPRNEAGNMGQWDPNRARTHFGRGRHHYSGLLGGSKASASVQDCTCRKAPIHPEARYHRNSEALLGGPGLSCNNRHLGALVPIAIRISISSTTE